MEFVVEHDMGSTRAVLLGRQGKYGEAVMQYLDEDQEPEALDLALEHIDDVMRNEHVFNAIVRTFLWRHLSFGCRGRPESAVIPLDKIVELLKRIPDANLNDGDIKMVCGTRPSRENQLTPMTQLFVFKLILQNVKSRNIHRILSNHVLRCESLNNAVKLLALDFFFDDMSWALDVSTQTEIILSLQLFHEYSLLIRDAALDKNPWDSLLLSTLFQFEKDGEGIRIRPGTFIYEDYKTRGPCPSPNELVEQPEQLTVSLPREEFAQNLCRLLSERLNSRIESKDSITSRLRLFNPCVQLTLWGECHNDHTFAHQLDEGWFNRRARFHLQNIMILDNLHALGLVEFPTQIHSKR